MIRRLNSSLPNFTNLKTDCFFREYLQMYVKPIETN